MLKATWLRLRERLINLYPPLLGAGIRSFELDKHTIRVEMKLTPLNINIVGVHFGGSLYAMCDPWFMLILMRTLGTGYIVWDKAANIRFLRPGRGKVSAHFHITPERVDEIRRAADSNPKVEPLFSVDILDEHGQIIAQVEKLLYIRKKEARERN